MMGTNVCNGMYIPMSCNIMQCTLMQPCMSTTYGICCLQILRNAFQPEIVDKLST